MSWGKKIKAFIGILELLNAKLELLNWKTSLQNSFQILLPENHKFDCKELELIFICFILVKYFSLAASKVYHANKCDTIQKWENT